MKNKTLILILLMLPFSSFQQTAINIKNDLTLNEPRKTLLYNFDWKFHRGDVSNAHLLQFDDSEWRMLQLPHDWSIEDLPNTDSPLDPAAVGGINTGYYTGGTGWYRKTFFVPDGLEGKVFRIKFEGVHMNADVWLNGVHLRNHPYGYTSFEIDLSEHIRHGKDNVLAVQVKNEGRNSRWYSGSGIYRNVWLTMTSPLHFKTWGVAVSTPEVSSDAATVQIVSEIVNDNRYNGQFRLSGQIIDQNGDEVAQLTENLSSGGSEELKSINTVVVSSPLLWSTHVPNLYKLNLKLQDSEGKVIDTLTETFGIRSIEFNLTDGFLLNGQPVLMKGACVHHDNGPLGAAAFPRAEERRVELLKASGFNAIRCAHNPPSTAFLDACDRLGMLVIDESFDMWRRPKNPQDYHLYFDEHWKNDIRAMVLRDRNHPSIIMWSTGNEIPERGEPEGAETSRMLSDFIKKLDPTRPVTAAVNGLNPDKDPYFATLDLAGYNYSFGGDHGCKSIFKTDHERVPDRIMYCAESYPLEAFGAWMEVLDHSYVFGDFVWTGFDYLGESSIGWRGYPHDESFYPWNHAWCGDIDICGNKRPQSYYRDVLWEVGDRLSLFVKPPVPSFPEKENRADWSKWHWHDHVANWNWEEYENKPLEVIVYSGHPEVELFLNGESLGVRRTAMVNKFMAGWNVPWQPGELKVVARNGDQIMAEKILLSAGKPSVIKLSADKSTIAADGFDLSYISIELHDEHGVRHPNAENLMYFELIGPGEIVAVANSNPVSTESFKKPKRKAWQGRGLVIVKAGKEKGELTLKVTAEGFEPAEILIACE